MIFGICLECCSVHQAFNVKKSFLMRQRGFLDSSQGEKMLFEDLWPKRISVFLMLTVLNKKKGEKRILHCCWHLWPNCVSEFRRILLFWRENCLSDWSRLMNPMVLKGNILFKSNHIIIYNNILFKNNYKIHSQHQWQSSIHPGS